MRDDRGRFVRGNIPVNPRDKQTGRFTNLPSSRYEQATKEVDMLLDNLIDSHLKEGRHGI